MGLRDFTLFDIVARNARLYPNRVAFIFEAERVTHAAYLARVERLAAGLARVGIVPGDRIVMLSQNNLEFVDLYGAVARLGAILVPINWRLSAEEVAYVAADAAPKVVIADAGLQPVLQGKQQALPTVERWYGIGRSAAPFLPYASLLANGATPGQPPAQQHGDANAGFAMFHTAAVGGRPRGAHTPYQLLKTKPGRPDSATVGTSGRTPMRFALVTAMDLSLPDFSSDTEPGVEAKLTWICPAMTSVVAIAAPLYGTSVILMPAM